MPPTLARVSRWPWLLACRRTIPYQSAPSNLPPLVRTDLFELLLPRPGMNPCKASLEPLSNLAHKPLLSLLEASQNVGPAASLAT